MDPSIKDVLKMQREVEEMTERLNKLSTESEAVKKALAFREELNDLLQKHKFSEDDLREMLQVSSPKKSQSRTRKQFIYRNPHTGEHVKTRGANHTKLKEWREKYGADVVDSWKEPAPS